MSHFTVMVIGDDIDAQLEPFWELALSPEEAAAADPRSKFNDCTDEVDEKWEDLPDDTLITIVDCHI